MEETEQTKPKRVVSLDTRLKMRQRKLENPTRFWAGKSRPPLTQETKDKIRAKLKGIRLSPEHIKNMVEARIRSNKKKREQLELLNKLSQQNDVQPPISTDENPTTTTESPS